MGPDPVRLVTVQLEPLIRSSPVLNRWFMLSVWAWIALELWVWLREIGGTKGESRDRGSRVALVVLIWIGIYEAVVFSHHLAGTIRYGALAWFWIGIVLLWLGIALRWWSIHTLGRFFRTAVILQGGHRVVTRGPYRRIRNPSYTGALGSVVGLGLCLGNWYSLFVATGFTLAGLAVRIRVEQGALAEHFGQPYRDYMARSWALIPFFW